MRTDELVQSLARELVPVNPGAIEGRVRLFVTAGMILSFALMLSWLGIRPDLATAAQSGAFWIKFAYTAILFLFAFRMVERLARPGGKINAPLALAAATFFVMTVLAVVQFASANPADHQHLLMGSSANVCPWRILLLAVPIFIGVFWALRALAPTRLPLAGAAAGLLAGAAGAWIYSFHCDESAVPFVMIWYTLGMTIVAAIGALVGRWLLRW